VRGERLKAGKRFEDQPSYLISHGDAPRLACAATLNWV
jgi:hypothetical protein